MNNLEEFLDISEEVKEALYEKKAVVALESTIISHGMPYPENVESALNSEKNIRENNAVPATIAIIKGRIKVYSDRVKKKVNKVTIRDNTSRWGSCSSNGNVSINFFLSYAPESIIDYVVVHELCHLIEMNHSKSFWQEVENLYPDYKAARKWLREEGRRLYTFL